MFVLGVIAAGMAAVAYGVSTVLRAVGARQVAVKERDAGGRALEMGTRPSAGSTGAAMTDPTFMLGTLMLVVGFAGGAVAARFLPLFLAQAIVSANLVVTALLGTIMLNITLHTRDWVAIYIVVLSLVMLGVSAVPQADNRGTDAFHWAILLASIVLSVLALLSVYCLGKASPIVGGAMAGLLYGMIAVAVRVLRGLDYPFDMVAMLADPAAWSIAICGVSSFWVQTVALQTGAVNGVTAVLVVGETLLPSAVGVIWLGDSARPDLVWLAIVGFIGSVIGAVLVAIYGSGDPDHFGEAPPQKGGWRVGRFGRDHDLEDLPDVFDPHMVQKLRER